MIAAGGVLLVNWSLENGVLAVSWLVGRWHMLAAVLVVIALGLALRSLKKLLGTLALGLTVLRLFFLDFVTVPHSGMAPTLAAGDRVVVWRRATADLGDIMLCQHPRAPDELALGRVVALAGHSIESQDARLIMDDEVLAKGEWRGHMRFYDAVREKLSNVRVGRAYYAGQQRHAFILQDDDVFQLRRYNVARGVYLLGDNRSEPAADSRSFGEVDVIKCKGQVFMRLWPATRHNDDVQHANFDWLL